MVNSIPKDVQNGLALQTLSLCTMCAQLIQMARDEARHGKALQGLLERYFK